MRGFRFFPVMDGAFEMTGFRKELGAYYYWKQAGKDVRDDQFLIMEGRTEVVAGLLSR